MSVLNTVLYSRMLIFKFSCCLNICSQTGILVFGEEDVMKNTIASLEANSVEFEILTGDTVSF